MKILKRITAIILATSIVTLSGCDNQTVNSGGSSESSESVSDLSSAMTSESSQQEESRDEANTDDDKNTELIFKNAFIQEITKIDENTLLAKHTDFIQLIDSNTYKIIKEIPGSDIVLVRRFCKGFVTISNSNFFEVFDLKGDMISHVDLPARKPEGEELEYYAPDDKVPLVNSFSLCISTDGDKVVYYSDKGLCTNNIAFDNEVVIHTKDEVNGGYKDLPIMIKPLLYKNDILYGEARKYNHTTNASEFFFASMNLKTKEWTIYQKLNKEQQIFSCDSFPENSFLIVDAGADYRFTEGKLSYFTIGDNEMSEFVCEEQYESIRAFISDNANFILTTHEHSINDAEIKLYDVKTGEVLLKQKVEYHAQTTYIDEDARKLYAVCGTEFSVFDF